MKPLIPIGVLLGVIGGVIIRFTWFGDAETPPRPNVPVVKPPPKVVPLPPLDPKALKDEAWKKALERIEAADRQAREEIDRSLKLLRDFFAQCKRGSRPFARDLLSLKGKWILLKSKVPGQDPDEHLRFLVSSFEERIFKGEDVEKALKATVMAHLSRLDGMDNQLLVDIRADIEGIRPDAALAIASVQSSETFKEGFRKARDDVTPLLEKDLPRFVAQEVLSFTAGNVAARLAVRVGAAIATRMGISAGILSSGAAAGIGTLGLSVVAGIVVDVIIDKILKQAGHDPEGEIAKRVNAAIDGLQEALIDGHPEALGVYREALKLADTKEYSELRREAKATADILEESGALGLKRDLRLYTEARCKQRRAALELLILGPSPSPKKEPINDQKLLHLRNYGVCLGGGLQ